MQKTRLSSRSSSLQHGSRHLARPFRLFGPRIEQAPRTGGDRGTRKGDGSPTPATCRRTLCKYCSMRAGGTVLSIRLLQGLKRVLEYVANVPCIARIDHACIKIKLEAGEMFAEDLNGIPF